MQKLRRDSISSALETGSIQKSIW